MDLLLISRSCSVGILAAAISVSPLFPGNSILAQDVTGDLNGDGIVDVRDYSRQLGTFTGALRPGEGQATPEDGDIDGDKDVDTLDQLVVLRQAVFAEEGVNCYLVGPVEVDLLYDPAVGSASIDTSSSLCSLVGFTLISSQEALRPVGFHTPFEVLQGIGLDRTRFQLGQIDVFLDGIPPGLVVDLGEILPPGLDEEQLLMALNRAEFAYLANGQSLPTEAVRKDFTLVRLELPEVGDTDRDSDVDTADLNQIIVHWTGADPDPTVEGLRFIDGDFDFDSDVDTADLNGALANWTGAAAARVSVVPEPAGAIWALLACYLGISMHGPRRRISCCRRPVAR